MQAFFAEGVEIDRCPFCGGVWFDGGELEQVLGRAVQIEPLGGATQRRCVYCRTTLETGVVGGVPLESCASCRSVYLDDGELGELARREISLQRAASPVPTDGDGGSAELTVRCEGCRERIPLNSAATTVRGLSCVNCFGMLDQSSSVLPYSGMGADHGMVEVLDAGTPGGIGAVLLAVWRLFSGAYR